MLRSRNMAVGASKADAWNGRAALSWPGIKPSIQSMSSVSSRVSRIIVNSFGVETRNIVLVGTSNYDYEFKMAPRSRSCSASWAWPSAGPSLSRSSSATSTAKSWGGGLRPSSDMPTHAVIYRAWGDRVGGVVHAHSNATVTWAQAGHSIPCYGTTQVDYCHGEVPCMRRLTEAEI